MFQAWLLVSIALPRKAFSWPKGGYEPPCPSILMIYLLRLFGLPEGFETVKNCKQPFVEITNLPFT
jgi:hypothetical protein